MQFKSDNYRHYSSPVFLLLKLKGRTMKKSLLIASLLAAVALAACGKRKKPLHRAAGSFGSRCCCPAEASAPAAAARLPGIGSGC
ncbi:hypothetical protein ACU4GD_13050 [Cupriavidus basilensis]